MKTVIAECGSCKGTGVFQGMGEGGGAYIQCYHCKGTGRKDVTYTEFTSRKDQPKCKRVYASGCGYKITDEDIEVDGKKMPFSQYGCSYDAWKCGAKPLPLKFLACPMRENQSACHGKEGFVDKCTELNGGWIGTITSCKMYECKSQCWERFEA